MLRKIYFTLGILIAGVSVPISLSTNVNAQEAVPAYAKWGNLAVKETQSKYPNASIIDYLYEGRETKENSTMERFKLWIKDGSKEFGVFVSIEYTTSTGELIKIEFQETPQ